MGWQASNLLRSLKQIREAAALGLLEDPTLDAIKGAGQAKPGAILGRRMQSFSRFVLEQTIKEMAATTGCKPDATAPATLFGTTVRTTTKCLNNKASHAETVRESRSLHFDLHYPSKADAAAPRQPFSALLQQSMSQVCVWMCSRVLSLRVSMPHLSGLSTFVSPARGGIPLADGRPPSQGFGATHPRFWDSPPCVSACESCVFTAGAHLLCAGRGATRVVRAVPRVSATATDQDAVQLLGHSADQRQPDAAHGPVLVGD